MPELPEVETIVRDLNQKVLKRAFLDVWTDFEKMIHLRVPKETRAPKDLGARPSTEFEKFSALVKNKKIQKIWRRAKNIIFELSNGFSLLIHQKLTGHLLYGYWLSTLRGVSRFARSRDNGYWRPREKGPLEEKVNTYIHLMFWLDNGKMLALSDLRKFAKVELWKTKELKNSPEFKNLGPEPLDKNFTFEKFKNVLKRKKGKVKQVLMAQNVIAGIGNIYSDEILWSAKIHPFKDVSKLNEKELREIYQAMREILAKAIKLGGESISDFRRISGEKGYFDKERKVYRKEGEKCFRCGTVIKRLKIGDRSARFCPHCQNL